MSPLTVAVTVTVSPLLTEVIPLESALTIVDESTAYTWTYPSALVTVIEPSLTDPAVAVLGVDRLIVAVRPFERVGPVDDAVRSEQTTEGAHAAKAARPPEPADARRCRPLASEGAERRRAALTDRATEEAPVPSARRREGVVVVVDELVAAGLAGEEVVAEATAAAPAPAPRITARPAAVLVSRDRRGLRAVKTRRWRGRGEGIEVGILVVIAHLELISLLPGHS